MAEISARFGVSTSVLREVEVYISAASYCCGRRILPSVVDTMDYAKLLREKRPRVTQAMLDCESEVIDYEEADYVEIDYCEKCLRLCVKAENLNSFRMIEWICLRDGIEQGRDEAEKQPSLLHWVAEPTLTVFERILEGAELEESVNESLSDFFTSQGWSM